VGKIRIQILSHFFLVYDNDTINISVIIDKREFKKDSREAGEEDEEVKEEGDEEVEEEGEDEDTKVLVEALMRGEMVLVRAEAGVRVLVGAKVGEGVGAVAGRRIKLLMNQVPEVVGSELRDLSFVKAYCR
jgi:hypothetical protein